ncbi:uncharacterized protein LOC139913158 isoform X2 [Centroberyx gerrardi]|uniref:uncharacterized protein isoform X2 n=1 Tax=Centroberyx gerrardi TaxID=166262 RepID=UPI003AAC8F7C
MSPVGEVMGSWSMSSGVVSLFLLLFLLSIFLTALCSDCGRRSFELQDPEVERNPSALIRVVKLEDAMVGRENPMMHEIRNDEKEENSSWYKPWRSHLGALQQDAVQISNGTPAVKKMQSVSPPADAAIESSRPAELNPEEENWYKPWRSHLGALQQDTSSSPSEPHIPPVSSAERHHHPTANPEPAAAQQEAVDSLGPRSVEEVEEDLSDGGSNPTYARVSRKVKCPTPPPAPPPGEEEKEEEEEEDSSPPLPGRMELEG